MYNKAQEKNYSFDTRAQPCNSHNEKNALGLLLI